MLATEATPTAPWWGPHLFTLLAALSTGLLVQAVNIYLHRRKAREDRDTAARTQRRDAITNFVAATHRYLNDPESKEAQVAFHAGYTLLEMMMPESFRTLVTSYYRASADAAGKDKRSTEVYDWLDAEAHLLAAARYSHEDFGLPKPA
jgi:hypothetical protein